MFVKEHQEDIEVTIYARDIINNIDKFSTFDCISIYNAVKPFVEDNENVLTLEAENLNDVQKQQILEELYKNLNIFQLEEIKEKYLK